MRSQVQALVQTLNAYGHSEPRRLATDKPAEDKAFFQARALAARLSRPHQSSTALLSSALCHLESHRVVRCLP
eukprot:6171287-Prymnesium_polylepis.1